MIAMDDFWSTFLTIVITVLSSGAVFGFIQFMIKRNDDKNDKQDEILKSLADLKNEFLAESARTSRIAILRFDEELLAGVMHSKEYFHIILDDIDRYEKYCNEHPEFKNNYTVEAVESIKKTYRKLKAEGKFKIVKGEEHYGT